MTALTRSDLRLVGDVGGTNCRFARVDTNATSLVLIDPRSFVRADFDSLEDAIDHYLGAAPGRPHEAVIAVAGPVSAGRVRLTNGRWTISEAGIASRGFDQVRLINDFEALALSVNALGPNDLGDIGGPADGQAGGTVAVLGAGTGLGVGALVRDSQGEAVAVSEGGHIAFAPTDDLEIDILRKLAGRFGRVSLERLLSGPGLVNLYEALAGLKGVEPLPLDPKDVVERATAGRDPLCAEALERFCRIYGAAAGDFALAYGATGGVYLGGGIAPRIIDVLRSSGFRAAFEAKGRFSSYCAAIPTKVILHRHAALLGAAVAPLGRG